VGPCVVGGGFGGLRLEPRRGRTHRMAGVQALGQHVLWGSLLLFLIIYGPGKLSLDYLLNRSRWSNQ